MNRGLKANVNAAGVFATDRKKIVIAVCVIGIMLFMWIRVLTRKSPQTALAVPPDNLVEEQSDRQQRICFINLPDVKGRNDVLSRDFFAARHWSGFTKEGENQNEPDNQQIDVDPNGDSEEIVRKVAEKLKLAAVVMRQEPQAYINYKVYSVGDKFTVEEGADKYECEVVEIKDKKVLIKCGRAKITIKLAQSDN